MVKCFVCGLSVSNKQVLEIHMVNHECSKRNVKLVSFFDWRGVMGHRLGRDMTDSTDWDLIFPITKEKLNAARRTFI